MGLRLSLESRLKLSIGVILSVIFALGSLLSVRDARDDVRMEATASLGLAVGLIDATLLPGNLDPALIPEWIAKLGELEKIRHLRISVTPSDAPAILPESRKSTSTDPAVPGWFSQSVMSAPLVVTREIRVGPGRSMRIRIESDAEDEIRESWAQIRHFMLLLAMFAAAIYLAVHMIAGRALRPVSRILRGLQLIEAGDYSTQLSMPGLPELDRIVGGINHVAMTLKDAQAENRALTRHSLAIQEQERQSLAKEIHDEVGQNLTAIKMMSAVILNSAEKREYASGEIQRLCDRLFSVVRSIIHRMRPMVLEDLGLKAALEDLADQWRVIAPEIHFKVNCDNSLEMLRGEMALEIYRMVQEGLTNTVRHSGASESVVTIQKADAEWLVVIVKDNGHGLLPDGPRRGFGLLGMRERVASLQGRFEVVPQLQQGLEIRIRLPLVGLHHD